MRLTINELLISSVVITAVVTAVTTWYITKQTQMLNIEIIYSNKGVVQYHNSDSCFSATDTLTFTAPIAIVNGNTKVLIDKMTLIAKLD